MKTKFGCRLNATRFLSLNLNVEIRLIGDISTSEGVNGSFNHDFETTGRFCERGTIISRVNRLWFVRCRGRKPGSGRKNGGAGAKGKDKKLSGTESEQEVSLSSVILISC